MTWTSPTDAIIWSTSETKNPRIILVREGRFAGVWTSIAFNRGRLPRQVRLAIEQFAGRMANAHHVEHDPDSPSPNPPLSDIRHSPSQAHWNRLLMLVIAGHAEVLG